MSREPGASWASLEIIPEANDKIIHDPLIEVSGCRLFREIDLASVYEFLGRDFVPVGIFSVDSEPWAEGLDECADETPVVSPLYTLALLIEKNLYVGNDEDKLDNLLNERAGFLADAVRDYMQERNDRLAKLKADTLNRYD